MAGIGFELKKLFRKDSIFSTIFGGVYATVITIGPTILVIVAINLLYLLLPYANMSLYDKELLASIILYVFIFSLVITSPVNIILSRYIADKIYEEDYDSILPSIDSGNLAVAALAFFTGVPFSAAMYFIGGIPFYRIALSYFFYTGLVFTFYHMTFVTLLKDYRKITYSFLLSLIVGILLSLYLVFARGITVLDGIVAGLAVSFNLIAVLLMSRCKRNFRHHNKNTGEVWKYFVRFRKLFAANAFYTLGLYSSNFVFWIFSRYKILVAGVFASAPVYDVATYLAMITNISVLVIFVINVETKFHTAYQIYCQSIIGASGKDILQAKRHMIDVLRRELLYIIQLQLIINVCIVLLVLAFGEKFGFSGTILQMYPVLAVAYMIMYLVQCMMIFLFYLDDAGGAAMVGFVFLVCSTLGCLVSVRMPAVLSGGGVLLGTLAGFTTAFFRIRYMLRHIDEHIYCRDSLLGEERRRRRSGERNKNVVVYSVTNKEG